MKFGFPTSRSGAMSRFRLLISLLVGIFASQFLLQCAVLFPVDETSLVSCPRCSFQAIGQHFAFACENDVVCALTGNAIVRRSWFNPPDPFDLDVFWQLSPCATRCCYEHADGVCGGKVEHGDDGFAVEQGTGPDGHDYPCIRVAWIGHPLFKLVEPVSDFRNAPTFGILDKLVVAHSRFSCLRRGDQSVVVCSNLVYIFETPARSYLLTCQLAKQLAKQLANLLSNLLN